MTDRLDPYTWWRNLSATERATLDGIARRSPLELERFPFWSVSAAAEVLAWLEAFCCCGPVKVSCAAL